MVNPYQGRVPYLYLRAHKIVLKKPNPTMNRTAVSIVEVTNIKERELIQFNTEVNRYSKLYSTTSIFLMNYWELFGADSLVYEDF